MISRDSLVRWNHEELRKIAENGSWFYPKKEQKKKKKDASYGDFGKNLKNNTVDL